MAERATSGVVQGWHQRSRLVGASVCGALVLAMLASGQTGQAQGAGAAPPGGAASGPASGPAPRSASGPVSGQPVPRFVSLKSDRVNIRRGPGHDHAIEWVFRRAGLPVEVIAEAETWRRVRDAEGATGWVLAPLLSGRRTVLVEPWELKPGATAPQITLRAEARDTAAEVARVEAGAIAGVRSCDGRWCDIGIGDLRGWVEQRRLWGVYKGETVKP
jgi:SH3-like domain-containing protein